MNDEQDRWARVKEILADALEAPVADRAAFLESACAGDAALRREVEALLASEHAAGSFLDVSAMEAAGLASASRSGAIASRASSPRAAWARSMKPRRSSRIGRWR